MCIMACSADADAWLAHCRRQCARWARGGAPLRFAATRLTAPAGRRTERRGLGPTRALSRACVDGARAAARRWCCLHSIAATRPRPSCLQALRGGGVAGLAGMPSRSERHGLVWARPWLQRPREAIEAYVRRHRLQLHRRRQQRRPALRPQPPAPARVAGAAAMPSRTPRARSRKPPAGRRTRAECWMKSPQSTCCGSMAATALDVAAWLRCRRRASAMPCCAWLRQVGVASASLVERLMAELPGARSGTRWPTNTTVELRLYRGQLRLEARPPDRAPTTAGPLTIDRPGVYVLPRCNGRLIVRRVKRDGVAATLLAELR